MLHAENSWDYYRIGMDYAGLKILDVKTQGTNQRATIYRVRYDCCGSEADITHERIIHRIRTDVLRCGKCAQGGWRFFDDGEIVTGYEILARVSIGRQTQKKTIYKIRTTCCDKKFDCSHYCLVRRGNDGTILCRDCAAIQGKNAQIKKTSGRRNEIRAQRRKERLLKKELKFSTANQPYMIRFRPEWPVPSHVPIGVHVLWEDRMCA